MLPYLKQRLETQIFVIDIALGYNDKALRRKDHECSP
jgi:hypothetical protein